MIHVVKRLVGDYDVHLASSSPRRKSILEHVDLPFTITPSTFEENLDKSSFSHPRLVQNIWAHHRQLDSGSFMWSPNHLVLVLNFDRENGLQLVHEK